MCPLEKEKRRNKLTNKKQINEPKQNAKKPSVSVVRTQVYKIQSLGMHVKNFALYQNLLQAGVLVHLTKICYQRMLGVGRDLKDHLV